ncbi:interleukin-21 [Genypterus blacodes]|uniref:interleukin-21 n=1 Tax=Genypterus blacodes TaxID=154954 RepID=UPI003F772D6F
MKLALFCFLVVGCCCLADVTASRSLNKLKEALKEVRKLKESLQDELLLNIPPQNIEDCCCLPALHCFRDKLMKLNVTDKDTHTKLGRSLRSHHIESSLNFCNSVDAQPTTCQTCDSQLSGSSSEFIDRLQSLIQRAVVKLNMSTPNP